MVGPSRARPAVAGIVEDLGRDGPGWVLLTVPLGWFLTLGVRVVYPAMLPQVTAEFGVGNATAGAFVGLLWTTYALLQFPGGALADAVGERLVLAGSVLLTAGAVAAIVLSGTVELFVVATVLLGLGTGLYGTTRLTVISAVYDRMETTAISPSQAAAFVGLSVPAFALLTVVEAFPAPVAVVLLLSCLLGAMPPVNAAGLGALPAEIRGSGFGLLRTCYIAFGAVGPPTVGLLADAGRFDGAFLLLGGAALALSVWGLLFERVDGAP
jgi:sugar phosphate permease